MMKILALLSLAFFSITAQAVENGGFLYSRYIVGFGADYQQTLCYYQDNGALACDGGADISQNLTDLTALSFGKEHYCAVVAERVFCSGKNEFGQAFSPNYGRVTAVAVGQMHSCALGDFGVRCWGSNESGQTDVPALKNPGKIYAAFQSTCAMDDEGVKCWGEVGKYAVPGLKRPRSVAVGYSHACSIDDEGLKCWGNPTYLADIPKVKNPLRVNVKGVQTCVLGEEEVACNRDVNFKPVKVAGSRLLFLNDKFCLLSNNAWCPATGSASPTKSGKFAFATQANPAFDLEDVAGYLSMVLPISTGLRYRILQSAMISAIQYPLANERTPGANAGRYLTAQLIAPAILGNDSTYGREKLAPAFLKSMAGFEEKLGYRGLDSVPLSADNCAVAWPVVKAVLFAAGDLFGPSEKEKLQNALREVAQAQADPANAEKRRGAVGAIDAASANWERMKGNPKTAFLAETIQTATAWLGR